MVAAHDYSEFVPLTYYGSAPYSIPEVTTRWNLYGNQGVPDAWFDGMINELGGLGGGQSMFSYYNTDWTQRRAVSSPLSMTAEWKMATTTAGTLFVHIDVASTVTTTSNVVHFAIVEEGLSTYGVTPGLCRDMLADETFTLTTPGQSVDYVKPFTLSPTWVTNNIGFVIFVQTHSSPYTGAHEVLQAVRATPGDRMEVTPETDFVSAGPVGGPFTPATATYFVENLAATPIDYSVTTDEPWVEVTSGGSGTLAGGATAEVTVEIGSYAQVLGAGVHRAGITFSNLTTGLGSTTREALLEVGERVMVFSWPLNANPVWTTTGLWSWGQPTGGGGQNGYPDPTSGHTNSYCYAYNLNGDYENNLVERYLTMPGRNFEGYSGVQLRFWRWLGVGDPSGDHAKIFASNNGVTWVTVWENTEAITDNAWVQQTVDLSAVADNQGVYVRFVMGTTNASGQYCGWNIDDVEYWAIHNTASDVPDAEVGARLRLLPSTPNPFRDVATIAFELPAPEVVRVAVYDLSGRLVREVWNDSLEAGVQTTHWDGTDADGRPVASGVYFCRVEAGGASETQRLVVLK